MPVVSVDAGTLPLTHTENVFSLISDSGVTRYRLTAAVWDTYSPAEAEPYWKFPEKFHLDNLDSLLTVTATVDSDTAYYFEKQELWRLTNNVKIKNMEGVLFETEELFWNQRAQPDALDAIYSTVPVKVTLPNGDVQHHAGGFKSDKFMHLPRFYNTSEIITFVEQNENATDTLINE